MSDIIEDLEHLNVSQNGKKPKSIEEMLKTEIRFLEDEQKLQIAKILEERNNFEDFMLALPKHLNDLLSETDDYERKYNTEHVKAIKNASDLKKRGRLNGEILFDEWGTSGRQRPCIIHLMRALDKVFQIRASNILRTHIGICDTDYDSKEYRSVVSECSKNLTLKNMELQVLHELQNEEEDVIEQIRPPPAETINVSSVKEYSYNDIKEKTNNFNMCKYEGFQKPGRFIGAGGFGKVYLAMNLVEDVQFVAVKVMEKLDDQKNKNFLREINLICEVEHVYILKLLGYSFDRVPCLIYDYAAGGPLSKLLSKARKGEEVYDFKDRVKNLWEISNALVFLHFDKGLVHRDIKPDNILLDGRVAKLCDFGLTKPLVKGYATNTRCVGTNNYMAPELLQSVVTAAADVYAFGLVMLEALTDLKLRDDKRRNKDEQFLTIFVKNRLKDPEKHLEFMKSSVGMPQQSEARLKLIEHSLMCARLEKTERPTMKFINEKLLERLGCY